MKKQILSLTILLILLSMMGCVEVEKVKPEPFPTNTKFEASQTTIFVGETVELSWVGTGGYVEIENNIGLPTVTGLPVTGSLFVKPTKTITYTLYAYGGGYKSKDNKTVTITVLPLPNAPIITVTAPTEAIKYYDSTSFSWVASGEITKVTLNDNDIANNGTFQTPRLVRDTVFTLKAFGPGGTTTKVVTIQVGDWTTSPIGLLTKKGWKLKLIERRYYDIYHPWFIPYPLDAGQLANTHYYTLDRKFYTLDGNNQSGVIDTYTLTEVNGILKIQTLLSNSNFEILTLTPDSLVLMATGVGHDMTTGETYVSYTKSTFTH